MFLSFVAAVLGGGVRIGGNQDTSLALHLVGSFQVEVFLKWGWRCGSAPDDVLHTAMTTRPRAFRLRYQRLLVRPPAVADNVASFQRT